MIEEIFESFPEEVFYTADGLEEAVIGVDEKSMKIIYSVRGIIDILMTRDKMGYEEALEFYEYNISGAYIGDGKGNDVTPIYCYDIY